MKSIFPILIVVLLAGCAKRPAKVDDAVRQSGVPGHAASVTCSNLVQRGNLGMGFLADGAFILRDQSITRVDANGHASPAAPDAMAVKAVTTTFEVDRALDVGDMSYAVFVNTLTWKRPAPSRIYAIRADAVFDDISLDNNVKLQHVRGTLVGFIYPDYLDKVCESALHVNFLSADGKTGGTVVDFKIKQGRIELDECDSLQLDLPEK